MNPIAERDSFKISSYKRVFSPGDLLHWTDGSGKTSAVYVFLGLGNFEPDNRQRRLNFLCFSSSIAGVKVINILDNDSWFLRRMKLVNA